MSASDPLWLVFGASGDVGRNIVPHREGRPLRTGDQIDSWRVLITEVPELLGGVSQRES